MTGPLRTLLASFALLTLAAPAAAQRPAPVAPAQAVAQAESDVRSVDRALDGRVDDDARQALRDKASGAGDAASDAADALARDLALVDARIAGLGPAPPGGEPADIARQRAALTQQHDQLDAQVRRAKLAQVEARQLVDEIDRSKAERFAQTVATRIASPVTPAFWRTLATSVPRDERRIAQFLEGGEAQIEEEGRRSFPWAALLGLLLALVLLFPARVLLARAGQRWLIHDSPGHRVRRSAYALWRVVTGTAGPLAAAAALVAGLRWSGLLPERWSGVLDAFVRASGFAGFTAAVCGALLMRSQPSWRVAPIDDEVAKRLRPLSWGLVALSFGWILLEGFNDAVGASYPARTASRVASTLLNLVLIGAFLLALGRIRSARIVDEDAPGDTARASLGLVELVAWVATAVSAVALLVGYVGLAFAIVQFIGWGVILGSATYLVLVAVDDGATSAFTRTSTLGRTLTRGLGLRGGSVDQFGLILSGVGRALILLVALVLLLSPFGGGGGFAALFGRLGTLAQGVDLGGVAISPGAILRGVVVLVVGLALVRAFMRWLEGRYLPATDLDGSGRNSVTLIARYVGITLAAIWSLASLGIGVEKIALLLSALSVGIGFGLQAITQNFVSGLILLAERPIKIGDLIRVGTDEGDVRRISVRSTEIALADHSTLIVPNSDLITKPVLNKTLQGMGRVQIQFSIPIEEDAGRVRDILFAIYAGEDTVLADPAPLVFVDSIQEGRVLFNSFAHVASPRGVLPARSAVYLALLSRLRAEGIDIGTVPQKLEIAGRNSGWHNQDAAGGGVERPPGTD